MITVTPAAREQALRYLAVDADGRERDPRGWAIRISVAADAPPPGFALAIVRTEGREADRRFDADGFEVLLSPQALDRLEAVVLDFGRQGDRDGFRVLPAARDAGAGPARSDATTPVQPEPVATAEASARLDTQLDANLDRRVREELERNVNPTVAAHGGAIELADVVGGVARVRMTGGCQGCSAARLTLKGVVERMLRARVPGIGAVEDVTDHEAGSAPWLGAPA